MLEEARRHGGTITSFASWCGGLPAPEAATNPLRYKFSWSPRGVLAAAQNSARYLREGLVVEVPGHQLLQAAEPVDFLKAFALEALPNRDALKYQDKYGLGPDVCGIYRGTLRFRGFSAIMAEIRQVGLLDQQPVSLTGLQQCPQTWEELMRSDLVKSTDVLSAETVDCLQWLGVWSDTPLVRKEAWSVADELCMLLQQRLSYAEGERDMVVMHHEIGVAFPDGSHETRTCTFVGYGQPNGASCMATTVGLTAAAGAHLLLTKQLATPGIVMPTISEVYEPVLHLLCKEGIKFEQSVRQGLGASAQSAAVAAAGLRMDRSPESEVKLTVGSRGL